MSLESITVGHVLVAGSVGMVAALYLGGPWWSFGIAIITATAGWAAWPIGGSR